MRPKYLVRDYANITIILPNLRDSEKFNVNNILLRSYEGQNEERLSSNIGL